MTTKQAGQADKPDGKPDTELSKERNCFRIRAQSHHFATAIMEECQPSDERTAALAKIDEVLSWATDNIGGRMQ